MHLQDLPKVDDLKDGMPEQPVPILIGALLLA
jgi:hypothetical protein